jgi:putative transposase
VTKAHFLEGQDMQYNAGKHCVFHHRYHIAWSTKYRYKVLTGALRVRVSDICR